MRGDGGRGAPAGGPQRLRFRLHKPAEKCYNGTRKRLRRFVAMDAVKGMVAVPATLVQYVYLLDNPVKYIDPLGLASTPALNYI